MDGDDGVIAIEMSKSNILASGKRGFILCDFLFAVILGIVLTSKYMRFVRVLYLHRARFHSL